MSFNIIALYFNSSSSAEPEIMALKDDFESIRNDIIGDPSRLSEETAFKRSSRAFSVQPKKKARCYSIALSNQIPPRIAGPSPAIRASDADEPDSDLELRRKMIMVISQITIILFSRIYSRCLRLLHTLLNPATQHYITLHRGMLLQRIFLLSGLKTIVWLIPCNLILHPQLNISLVSEILAIYTYSLVFYIRGWSRQVHGLIRRTTY